MTFTKYEPSPKYLWYQGPLTNSRSCCIISHHITDTRLQLLPCQMPSSIHAALSLQSDLVHVIVLFFPLSLSDTASTRHKSFLKYAWYWWLIANFKSHCIVFIISYSLWKLLANVISVIRAYVLTLTLSDTCHFLERGRTIAYSGAFPFPCGCITILWCSKHGLVWNRQWWTNPPKVKEMSACLALPIMTSVLTWKNTACENLFHSSSFGLQNFFKCFGDRALEFRCTSWLARIVGAGIRHGRPRWPHRAPTLAANHRGDR